MKLAAVRLVAALLSAIALPTTAGAADQLLTTGRWSIVEMGGKRVRPPATLNFTRARWLGLNTSCGPSWGWYRLSGATIKIHIAGRMRFQTGSGTRCQGIDYQLLLGRVRTFDHDGDRVVFLGSDGKAIARLVQVK